MENTKKKVGIDLTQGNIFKQLMLFVFPLVVFPIVNRSLFAFHELER